ncbi:RNA polymerase II mediator complex protein, partial [Trichophyton equinum CBS 127.97]
ARESLSELIERRIEMAREDVKQMEEIEGRVAGWLEMMSKRDKVEEANDDKMQIEKEGEADQKKNPKRVSENDGEIQDARIMWRLLDEIEEAG